MTDRESFLAAIRAHPADDTARLVFADWLDEHGASDLDRATAEFIRASCRNGTAPGRAMPRTAYPWLKEHWRRLVPSAVALHVRPVPDGHPAGDFVIGFGPEPFANYSGRVVRAIWSVGYSWLAHAPAEPTVGRRAFACRLLFSRGFLETALTWSPILYGAIGKALLADQPLASAPPPRAAEDA